MSIFSNFAAGYRDARAQHVPRPSRQQPEQQPEARQPDDDDDGAAVAELESQLATAKETILEMADALEQHEVETAGLRSELSEAQAALSECEAILGFPGVRKLLLTAFHPDKNRPLSESERAALDDMTKRILAAYERIKGG